MDPASLPPQILIGIIAAAVVLAVVVGLAVRRRAERPDPASEAEASDPEAELPPRERFLRGLARTRDSFDGRIRAAADAATPEERLEALEEALLAADVGVAASQKILAAVRGDAGGDGTALAAAVRSQVRSLLGAAAVEAAPSERPWVTLVVGVNGVGKTTTIGKLAARHAAAGRSVLLVAGDTFRAAAGDQLAIWSERTGAQIVRQAEGSDPSSVVFDGVTAAVARGVDVVLVDTAGRLHTKVNLMQELTKVRRVAGRACPGAPHEVLLVLDATTGQNAISQARSFGEAVDVDGVILTKLDGSAKGGVAVAIAGELGLPVRYVGLGEQAADLQPFDPEPFAEALFGPG